MANGRKAKIRVAKIHQRIQKLKDEFLHHVSKKLVILADQIVFESLNINRMLKNHHLAEHIQDHSWGKLTQFTQSKAAKAGKVVELVDARYTSRKCYQCGIFLRRWQIEPILEVERDLNASINLHTLGLEEEPIEVLQ